MSALAWFGLGFVAGAVVLSIVLALAIFLFARAKRADEEYQRILDARPQSERAQ
jgi:hypothetical protein